MLFAGDSFVVIDAYSSIAFPVFPFCVHPRVLSEMMRAWERLYLRLRLLIRQGGPYIMLITFSSLAPSCRIERLLDHTTSYSCLSNKHKQPCPPHPSNFYVTIA